MTKKQEQRVQQEKENLECFEGFITTLQEAEEFEGQQWVRANVTYKKDNVDAFKDDCNVVFDTDKKFGSITLHAVFTDEGFHKTFVPYIQEYRIERNSFIIKGTSSYDRTEYEVVITPHNITGIKLFL